MRALESFSDADFRRTILRSIRLLLVLTMVALPLVWWRGGGWRGGAMLLVGAAISASGLWEWLRLLTAVMARMDASETSQAASVGTDVTGPAQAPGVSTTSPSVAAATQDPSATASGLEDAETAVAPKKVGGMAWLLTGFFVRLAVVVLVLYGSLRYLEGSVVALAAGLGLGVFSLTAEGLRLVKAWTV